MLKTLVASALALASGPAYALAVAGAVDPRTGLQSLLAYVFPLVGFIIVAICLGKGVHAVGEGRHLGPYIASAVGGTALAYGGSFLLTYYGVT